MLKFLMSPRTSPSSSLSPCMDLSVVRTGVVHVTSMGLFGLCFWKPRYVVLTTTKLRCYKFEGGDLKLELDLSECAPSDIQVMPNDCTKIRSFGASIWRIALNVGGQRYFIAPSSEYEMNIWAQDLLETAHLRQNPARELRPSLGVNPQYVAGALAFRVDPSGIGKYRSSIRRPPPPRPSLVEMTATA
ncbi:hypothetical protein H310_01500 [Aphanomyces invadans]|uniref:PH domain-containing protein n=1 Tax=Aphanomyces invadans TaxID=157072 RepID=A0A024USZ0_9STRA|nr:hypothetical protein H310_01500 [Aphanomyces invadans]ETW09032.1 hypothetical protein H310_01500 [Aphanomyces invadans]RHY33184.1 hypothetical protein DYB32_006191 [Aphanomyces invadans]|eukprot:XP_008862837.1 hypothetical protein H310_01500 [Aphanomyces invadans]